MYDLIGVRIKYMFFFSIMDDMVSTLAKRGPLIVHIHM